MKTILILILIVAGFIAGCGAPNSSAGMATDAPQQGSAQSVIAAPTAPTANHEGATARMFVKGMSCPLCATNIDKQLMHVRGVEHVSVNLGTGEVQVRLAPGNPPTREELAAAIERSGFTLDRIDMPQKGGE